MDLEILEVYLINASNMFQTRWDILHVNRLIAGDGHERGILIQPWWWNTKGLHHGVENAIKKNLFICKRLHCFYLCFTQFWDQGYLWVLDCLRVFEFCRNFRNHCYLNFYFLTKLNRIIEKIIIRLRDNGKKSQLQSYHHVLSKMMFC